MKVGNIPHHPGCTTNLPVDNAQLTLSVPRELATTWVTRSSTCIVQTAPNCSAVCHRGWIWGLASPSGKTRLKTIRQPPSIFCCSAASMLRTSASLRLGWEKKLRWIRSMTYFQRPRELRQYNQSCTSTHLSSIVEKQGPTASEEARVPSSGLSSLSISRSDGPGRPNWRLLQGK